MIQISSTAISIILGLIAIVGMIFTVFFYFKKPQDRMEKKLLLMEVELKNIKDEQKESSKEITIIKQDLSKAEGNTQKELKDMGSILNNCKSEIIRLSTIIEERIPKGTPNLIHDKLA